MRKVWMVLAAGLMVLGSANLATRAAAVASRRLTVRGVLLDMACYTRAGVTSRPHGKTCGRACLASGIPAGVLVAGKAWTLVTNPKPLANYVGLMVKVVGQEDAATQTIFPAKIYRKMGKMWMAVHLKDQWHK